MSFKVPDLKVPGFLKSVKYTLGVSNIVFALTGVLLLLAGIIVVTINAQHELFITYRFITVPSFSIATGLIILMVSLLGFYAAYSKQFYFVASYALLMFVIFIFDMSLVIVAYQLKNDAAAMLRPEMLQSLDQYSTMREVAQQWDNLHRGFECCGAVNRFDFIVNAIPVSCCHIDYGTISPFECTSILAYSTGCSQALGDWLSYNMMVLGFCALVATCIQVVLVFIASWLAWRSKSDTVELES